MTRVLVTGGAGYIGSVVTEALLAAGYEVVAFDDLSQGHRGAVHPDVSLVEGSLLDAEAVERVFRDYRGLDGVLHFAARSLVGESMQRPELYIGDNVAAGLNLLGAAARHGVGRFVLSSTANLFGEPRRIPIDEDEAIVPGSPYGESKWWLERALGWFERLYGLRYAALRYFNAAGASVERGEDHRPETHLIPLLLDVARGERDGFTLFGDDYPTPDGTCVRDYVHVLDLAQAHLLAFAALDRGSRVYNLGNGRGFSNREVVEAARRVTGQPIPFDVGPRRAGDPAVLVASSERIRQELGWRPAYPDLEDIVASAWAWRQRYPRGYEDGGSR